MSTEWKRLINAAKEQGCEVVQARRGGHLKIYRGARLIGTIPGTPSDRRGYLNQRAQLRREGIKV